MPVLFWYHETVVRTVVTDRQAGSQPARQTVNMLLTNYPVVLSLAVFSQSHRRINVKTSGTKYRTEDTADEKPDFPLVNDDWEARKQKGVAGVSVSQDYDIHTDLMQYRLSEMLCSNNKDKMIIRDSETKQGWWRMSHRRTAVQTELENRSLWK